MSSDECGHAGCYGWCDKETGVSTMNSSDYSNLFHIGWTMASAFLWGRVSMGDTVLSHGTGFEDHYAEHFVSSTALGNAPMPVYEAFNIYHNMSVRITPNAASETSCEADCGV